MVLYIYDLLLLNCEMHYEKKCTKDLCIKLSYSYTIKSTTLLKIGKSLELISRSV